MAFMQLYNGQQSHFRHILALVMKRLPPVD